MTQRGKARNRTGVRPSPGVATAGHRIAFGCFQIRSGSRVAASEDGRTPDNRAKSSRRTTIWIDCCIFRYRFPSFSIQTILYGLGQSLRFVGLLQKVQTFLQFYSLI